jgi:hypothetical protein
MKFIIDPSYGDVYPRSIIDMALNMTLACPICEAPAKRVSTTQDERYGIDCGRPFECCVVGFECEKKHRTVLKLCSPEAD